VTHLKKIFFSPSPPSHGLIIAHFCHGWTLYRYDHSGPLAYDKTFSDPRIEALHKKANKYFKNKDVLDIGCNTGHVTLNIANTSGFLVPLITGYLTNAESNKETWTYVWDIFIGMAVFGGFVYIFFCDCRQQEWALTDEQVLSRHVSQEVSEEIPISENFSSQSDSQSDEELLQEDSPILENQITIANAISENETRSLKSSSKNSSNVSRPVPEMAVGSRNNSNGSFLECDINVKFKSVEKQ